jgi:hypothetical protein
MAGKPEKICLSSRFTAHDPIPDMSGGVSFVRKAIHRSDRADRRQLSSLSFQRSTDGIMPERLSSGPISTVNPPVPHALQ